MNIAVTRAAEGFPRRAFTVADVHRMIEIGVIREEENFELIEGELVMMAAKSHTHDLIKNDLTTALIRTAPNELLICVENTLQLADDVLVEPDIAIVTRSGFTPDSRGFTRPQPGDVLLVIEVAVSSLSYDRHLKARLYARCGIAEFWVVDANERITWIHTGPSGDGWASIVERGPKDALTTPAVQGFSIRLADV
jgi:Uma2 family endonuclease